MLQFALAEWYVAITGGEVVSPRVVLHCILCNILEGSRELSLAFLRIIFGLSDFRQNILTVIRKKYSHQLLGMRGLGVSVIKELKTRQGVLPTRGNDLCFLRPSFEMSFRKNAFCPDDTQGSLPGDH